MEEPKKRNTPPPTPLPHLKWQNTLWGTKLLEALNPKGPVAG